MPQAQNNSGVIRSAARVSVDGNGRAAPTCLAGRRRGAYTRLPRDAFPACCTLQPRRGLPEGDRGGGPLRAAALGRRSAFARPRLRPRGCLARALRGEPLRRARARVVPARADPMRPDIAGADWVGSRGRVCARAAVEGDRRRRLVRADRARAARAPARQRQAFALRPHAARRGPARPRRARGARSCRGAEGRRVRRHAARRCDRRALRRRDALAVLGARLVP